MWLRLGRISGAYLEEFMAQNQIKNGLDLDYFPDRLVAKIQQLFTLLVPNHADRDYLIALLRDIKISNSVSSPAIDYSDDIKAIFIKYGIKYE